MRRDILTLIVLACLAQSRPVAGCNSTTCSLVSRTDDARLRAGGVQVDLSFRQIDQDRRLFGRGPATIGGAQDPPVLRPRIDFEDRRVVSAYHQEYAALGRYLQLDIGYGVSRRISVLASLPLFTERSIEHLYFPGTGPANHSHINRDSPRQNLNTSGIGDGQLTVRYAVTSQLTAAAGLKLATGTNTLKDEYGKVADPMSQPGTGAAAFVSTVQYGGRLEAAQLGWGVTASYQRAVANDLDYRVGDEAFLAAVATRKVASSLTGTLQVKGYHARRSEFMERPVDSTGATIVYGAPGLRWRGPGNVSVYGSIQVPVYQHVNEGQLGVHTVLTLGISQTF